MRHYGSSELADLLEAHSDEIETMMSGINGMQGYYLMRTGNGCASMTVCDDKAGTDESTRIATDWIRANAGSIEASAPEVLSGDVIAQVGSGART
jgi:hypothetical protein